MILAGLLNRTLVVDSSQPAWSRDATWYSWPLLFDLRYPQKCFGRHTVTSTVQYQEQYWKRHRGQRASRLLLQEPTRDSAGNHRNPEERGSAVQYPRLQYSQEESGRGAGGRLNIDALLCWHNEEGCGLNWAHLRRTMGAPSVRRYGLIVNDTFARASYLLQRPEWQGRLHITHQGQSQVTGQGQSQVTGQGQSQVTPSVGTPKFWNVLRAQSAPYKTILVGDLTPVGPFFPEDFYAHGDLPFRRLPGCHVASAILPHQDIVSHALQFVETAFGAQNRPRTPFLGVHLRRTDFVALGWPTVNFSASEAGACVGSKARALRLSAFVLCTDADNKEVSFSHPGLAPSAWQWLAPSAWQLPPCLTGGLLSLCGTPVQYCILPPCTGLCRLSSSRKA